MVESEVEDRHNHTNRCCVYACMQVCVYVCMYTCIYKTKHRRYANKMNWKP